MAALANPHLTILALLLVLTAAAWNDLRSHRIPNIITTMGIVLGLCLQTWAGGMAGLATSLGGLAVGLLTLLPLYALFSMGAGDVKLMAAVGAFLNPLDALHAALLSIVAGGAIGFFILLGKNGFPDFLSRWGLMARTLATTGKVAYVPPRPGEAAATRLPYALAIALATVALLAGLSPFRPLFGT